MVLPEVVDGVLAAIGRTPVVRLKRVAPPDGAEVFVKLEYFNPTGSYKDRMALAMIEGAEARGALRPGMRVVEYTGGSTGSLLAMVCAVKGYEFVPHAFCGGVGTAGMLVGVSRALKEGGSRARIVALEPDSSPMLTTGRGGPHRVEGIAVGFTPPHLTANDYDEARAIDEGDARVMARRLAKEEGLFAGTSTGLNVVAALQLACELGPGRRVATVAVDTGLKYLAGDLFAS